MEDFKVDSKPFLNERSLSLIYRIIRSKDLNQSIGNEPPIEELRKSLTIQLQQMVDFLSTTEEDQANARAYYTELYKEVFDLITKAKSADDIFEAIKKIKHEDITARFFGIIKGGWETLGANKRRGVETIKNPIENPSVKRIFVEVIPQIKAFELTQKSLK